MYKAKEEKRGLLTSEQQETLRKRAKQTYLLYDILSHLIFYLFLGTMVNSLFFLSMMC
jgi:hypothetical protein